MDGAARCAQVKKKGVPSSLWRATMLSKLCAAGGAWTDLTLTRRQSRILQSSLAGDKKITRDGKRGPKAAWASSAEKDVSSRSAFSSCGCGRVGTGGAETAVVARCACIWASAYIFGSAAACRGAAVVGARGNAPPTLLRTSTSSSSAAVGYVLLSCFSVPALD